jgi:endonuclease YncB( thermonuclease family)
MRRGLQQGVFALAAAVIVATVAGTAAPATAVTVGSFTLRGDVVRVVDGDTVDVALATGRRERVRLIGIDAPERGACYAPAATSRARTLALSKRVVLRGDATQATRDRYGRLLAYVWLPGGKDLGHQLLAGGFAKVYVHDRAFQRLTAYRSAETSAKHVTAGQWKACGTTAPAAPVAPVAPTGCHPSYSPCLPIVGDLDCADVRALGKAPVRVLGSDPYRLDGDADGYGCE